jgi:hypothetical protein
MNYNKKKQLYNPKRDFYPIEVTDNPHRFLIGHYGSAMELGELKKDKEETRFQYLERYLTQKYGVGYDLTIQNLLVDLYAVASKIKGETREREILGLDQVHVTNEEITYLRDLVKQSGSIGGIELPPELRGGELVRILRFLF